LKAYLLKAVDALIAGPMQVIRQFTQPLERLQAMLPSILDLQRVVTVVDQIPTAIERIGQALITVKDEIQSFNLSFLTEPLNRVLAEVVKPLEAINPEPVLVVPLTDLFNRVLRLLERLSPVNLLAGSRGQVTLQLATAPKIAIALPAGTPLVATTPVGEVWFETAQAAELTPSVLTVDVPVRALIPGEGGDIVTDEGVTWKLAGAELAAISVTRPAAPRLVDRILSLTTLVQQVLLAKLAKLHPVTLIADPLNQQFQKIVELIQNLGLTQLFDALFEKLERLNGEIETGLDRLGGAFGGLVAAMPL
jgi:hypothetical protein